MTRDDGWANPGPFYYSEHDYDRYKNELGGNHVYSANEYSYIDFTGEMTLYGKEGDTWMEIGTITFGFTLINNKLTNTQPTIIYKIE